MAEWFRVYPALTEEPNLFPLWLPCSQHHKRCLQLHRNLALQVPALTYIHVYIIQIFKSLF